MNSTESFRLYKVSRRFGDFELRVDNLSLQRGYVLGLVGRNGAGKSTLIKILLNLIYPDSGDVFVLGMKQPDAEIQIKRLVGYLSENPVFYDNMTVDWMARLVSRFYPTWDDSLYRNYLKKFDLDPRKKAKDLSKGMVVKLGLTLALSHKPELLVLDEPTSGIDPVVRHDLLREIAGVIRDEKRTVIFSSHITQDIEQVADFVCIIDNGSIMDFTDKESLLDRWKKVSGTFPDPNNGLSSLFDSYRQEGNSFRGVTGHFSPDFLNRIKAQGASNIKVTGVNLDEILVCISGKEM